MPEIIPRVEEYWIDSVVVNLPLKFKIGQYPNQVGNGYALGGYYENYGASIYSTNENFQWRVYYQTGSNERFYPLRDISSPL